MAQVERRVRRRQALFVSIPLASLVAAIIILLRTEHDLWAVAMALLGLPFLAGLDRVANRRRDAAGSDERVR